MLGVLCELIKVLDGYLWLLKVFDSYLYILLVGDLRFLYTLITLASWSVQLITSGAMLKNLVMSGEYHWWLFLTNILLIIYQTLYPIVGIDVSINQFPYNSRNELTLLKSINILTH
jgi:hypothetical protein